MFSRAPSIWKYCFRVFGRVPRTFVARGPVGARAVGGGLAAGRTGRGGQSAACAHRVFAGEQAAPVAHERVTGGHSAPRRGGGLERRGVCRGPRGRRDGTRRAHHQPRRRRPRRRLGTDMRMLHSLSRYSRLMFVSF